MTQDSAVRAIAGGLGVVAGIFTCAAVAAGVIVALGLPAESRADDPPPTTVAPEPRPTELVVALGLGDPVLQAGVVRDGEVIIARGLEVDLARDLARRLGIPRVRFVYVKPASRLLVGTVRPWDLDDRLDQAGQRRILDLRSQRSLPRHRSSGRAEARTAAALDAR